MSVYLKISSSKTLRGLNSVYQQRRSDRIKWIFEYPNVVADKPKLGPEGPLTKIFSDIPTIFFRIYERSFQRYNFLIFLKSNKSKCLLKVWWFFSFIHDHWYPKIFSSKGLRGLNSVYQQRRSDITNSFLYEKSSSI